MRIVEELGDPSGLPGRAESKARTGVDRLLRHSARGSWRRGCPDAPPGSVRPGWLWPRTRSRIKGARLQRLDGRDPEGSTGGSDAAAVAVNARGGREPDGGRRLPSRGADRVRRRRRRRILAGVIATVVVAAGIALVVVTRGPRPGSGPARVSAAVSGRPGVYVVGSVTLPLVDAARDADVDGHLEPRSLPTVVRYPTVKADAAGVADGPFPLVVFAPGFLQCAEQYDPLLQYWASAGYVVAAVDFPLTNCNVAAQADENDVVNQPADVAYVIDQVLADSAKRQGPLAGLVDPSRVGVAGHSDGGDTVAALAADSCCTDKRLRAVIVLAGGELSSLGGSYFTGPTPPMLFVQGTADPVNPPSASLDLYSSDTTGVRYYLQLEGAGHYTPYEGVAPPEPTVARVTLDFWNRYLAESPGAKAALRHDHDISGASLVSGGESPAPTSAASTAAS